MAESASFGLLEVSSENPIGRDGASLSIDFSGVSDVELNLNGRSYRGAAPVDVVSDIERYQVESRDQLLSIPYRVSAHGATLRIEQPAEILGALTGSWLTGADAERAASKASSIAGEDEGVWLPDVKAGEADLANLDSLVGKERWDGPLVVSMPRTGSTLFGILLLMLHNPPGSGAPVFNRYLHEPVAPVFWEHEPLESVGGTFAAPLTASDIVQESAYQFANRDVARWFLSQARQPIVFIVRHPQLSWPSRWRILLSKTLAEGQTDDDDRIRAALEADDYSQIGDVLTAVRPPDNGFYPFVSLLEVCQEEGIDYVIVDNARFRDHPDAMLAELCDRFGLAYDDAMTTWSDLTEVASRVVMGELARKDEYRWYYEGTMSSSAGIIRNDRDLVNVDRFPEVLRGVGGDYLSIDEAVTWYYLLLARNETLA